MIKGVRPTVTGAQANRIAAAVGVDREAIFLPQPSASADEDRKEGPMSPEERKLRAQIAAHASHAAHPDGQLRTAKARQAAEGKFLAQAREMHPAASEAQLMRVAEHLRKAHMRSLALKSAQARRRNKATAAQAA
jgi:hypothetical protein